MGRAAAAAAAAAVAAPVAAAAPPPAAAAVAARSQCCGGRGYGLNTWRGHSWSLGGLGGWLLAKDVESSHLLLLTNTLWLAGA